MVTGAVQNIVYYHRAKLVKKLFIIIIVSAQECADVTNTMLLAGYRQMPVKLVFLGFYLNTFVFPFAGVHNAIFLECKLNTFD